jgi:hypothetical protein
MTQPETSTSPIESAAKGKKPFPLLERLAYAVALGAIILAVVILLPALIWPNIFGRLMNGYTWTVILAISYICAPFCHRYVKRTKWG